jgi:hypothetical protein
MWRAAENRADADRGRGGWTAVGTVDAAPDANNAGATTERAGLVEDARREVGIAFGDGDRGVTEDVANELEAPGLAPPAGDERARAAVAEIVPAHRAAVVALRGVVQLCGLEETGPSSRLLARLAAASAFRWEHEAIRVGAPTWGHHA